MDLARLDNKMNRQQIIIAQREAMDKLDAASSKYASCRRRGQCKDSKGICLECPAYLAKQEVQKHYDQCTKQLKLINSQIVKNNDVRIVQQYEERKAQRIKKRTAASKPLIINNKVPRKTKKKEGSQETMRTNTPPSVAQENRNLTRNDLTEELYIHHKLVDKLSDAEIQNMYNIPKTTFEKWKRDEKMSKKVHAAANDPNRAESNEVDTVELYSHDQQLHEQNKLLKEKFAKLEVAYAAEMEQSTALQKQNTTLRQQLQIEREMNQARHETIVLLEKDKIDLEQQINRYQNTESTAIPIEQDDVDYKQLYEDTQEILKEVRAERDFHKTRGDRLRDTLDDTTKHYNEQLEAFRDYECSLLERLIHEIKN